MNKEECKYCDYVSKCMRRCEYGSLLCKINRSFPKIVNKSYEELQQENQELKKQLEEANATLDTHNELIECMMKK